MNHLDFDNDFDTAWKNAVSKCYCLLSPEDDNEMLCDDASEFFSTLKIEKTDLNSVKSLLNDIDIVAWHKHTGNMHLFSSVPAKLRHHIKAELPTQAWAKFYCILSNFDIVKTPTLETDVFYSVHLCEAPGAFITSLNHFIKNSFGSEFQWDWLGTTLNPYYEGNELGKMIPDDRFIIKTLEKWFFGVDFSGNIMDLKNLNALKIKLENTKVHLVTADGSIDCSDDPGEQEDIVFPLFLWETITALDILSDGGTFVIKMFTMFEKHTVTLMYLLSKVFDTVSLFKPGPSKPGNSEVYVVAQKFDACSCQKLELFSGLKEVAVAGNFKSVYDLIDFSRISKPFMQSIREYVEESCSLQKAGIHSNRRTFQNLTSSDTNKLEKMKRYFSKRFVKELKIERIEDYISPMFKMMVLSGQFRNQKQNMIFKKGSLEQRKSNKNKRFKVDHESEASTQVSLEWYDGVDILTMDTLFSFEPIVGTQYTSLCSSLFCCPSILQTFREFATIPQSCSVDTTFPNLKSNLDETVFEQLNCHVVSENTHFVEILCRSLGNINENNFDTIIFDLQHLTNDVQCKKNRLRNLLDHLTSLKNVTNLCIHFHGLLLSSFWVGVMYLLMDLFENASYYCPSSKVDTCLYMVFTGFKGVADQVEKLERYIQKCLQKLETLQTGEDVLHLLPIQNLMQSDFRQYVKRCNNVFVQAIYDDKL